MMFAKKCPKCGGTVQTKSIKKSIGLGFVNIPVAQFCLNPACDWYQDFSEQKEPEDIKEGILQIKVPSIKSKLPELKKPNLSQKHTIALAAVIVIIGIYILFSYLITVSHFPEGEPQQPDMPKTNTPLVNTTQPPAIASTQTPAVPQVIAEQKKYSIKFDVSHGFNPKVLTINRSDTVIWNNDENQRPRMVLVSKGSLFKNRLMEYSEKYPYQFNQSGSYIFVLAEYPSLNEYPNATNEIIVK